MLTCRVAVWESIAAHRTAPWGSSGAGNVRCHCHYTSAVVVLRGPEHANPRACYPFMPCALTPLRHGYGTPTPHTQCVALPSRAWPRGQPNLKSTVRGNSAKHAGMPVITQPNFPRASACTLSRPGTPWWFAHHCNSALSPLPHAQESALNHFRLLPLAPPPAPYCGRSPIPRRLLPRLRLRLHLHLHLHLHPWRCLQPLPAAPGKTAVAAGTLRGVFVAKWTGRGTGHDQQLG